MGVPVTCPSGRPAWFTQYKMWSHCRGDDQQTENHTTVNTQHMVDKIHQRKRTAMGSTYFSGIQRSRSYILYGSKVAQGHYQKLRAFRKLNGHRTRMKYFFKGSSQIVRFSGVSHFKNGPQNSVLIL
jgi:hypothetical protein